MWYLTELQMKELFGQMFKIKKDNLTVMRKIRNYEYSNENLDRKCRKSNC